MTQTAGNHRLITIVASHYCEKARWALDLSGLAYSEEPHAPLFHRKPVRRAKGGKTVPVLVTPTGVLENSQKILRYVSGHPDSAIDLYDHGDETKIAELEQWFDDKLGSQTRRWAYHFMLPDADLCKRCMLGDGRVSGFEATKLKIGFPLLRWLIRKGLRITPEKAESSRKRILALFEETSEILADGRPFLTGDRFSAADLTFAALASPAFLPSEYGSWLPPREGLPAAFREFRARLMALPAGHFAERLYREHRRPADASSG